MQINKKVVKAYWQIELLVITEIVISYPELQCIFMTFKKGNGPEEFSKEWNDLCMFWIAERKSFKLVLNMRNAFSTQVLKCILKAKRFCHWT